MKTEIYLKIKNNTKLHDYLINNSYWYKILNRTNNMDEFIKSYNQNKKEQKLAKMSNTLDSLDTINSILKILK